MKKQWQILRPDIHAVEHLCRVLKIGPVTAAALVNRKIISPEKASSFLNPSLGDLRSPVVLKDIDPAVCRISDAITRYEKILVFGDYDVDGITATAILLEFFRYVGADVSYYIPHRIREGYSLKINHISDLALPNRIKLIITADCGSDSHDAVTAAKAAGIDVVITDHHKAAGALPQAVAVVNPNRHDCPSDFEFLSGVGVAFYLLICLRKYLRDLNFWKKVPEPNLKRYCDFVALGTVADMVPLVDENRALLMTGLDIINSNPRPGIKALIEASKRASHSIDNNDIAFGLAPRLNAAGRMGNASSAVELLTTTNIDTAREIARSLNQLNLERREIEDKIYEEIRMHIKHNPFLLKNRTLVLAHHGWHEGIVGIVAARIVKKHFRPVVLIVTQAGVGKGSARSIPGFDLYQGLRECGNCLENFGGHSMAAGLKIKTENIEAFQRYFEDAACKMIKPDDFVQKILIDYELDFDDISDSLVDELELLMPFGTGNTEPLFMARNLEVLSSKIVGENHRHVVLRQPSSKTGKVIHAIHFNINPHIAYKAYLERVAFRLRWNRWSGKKRLQIVIEEI